MTICIASITSENYAIVVSDRMITVTLPNVEFEQSTSKTIAITKNCVAATAGSALAYTPIFRDAKSEIDKISASDISLIAEITKNSYVKMRNKKIEEEILSAAGLTLQTFYQLNQAMATSISGALFQALTKYNYNLWILLCGVDDSGPHIYRLQNPSKVECFDTLGYLPIGSGEHLAISTFIANNFDRNFKLKPALAVTYEAKKRAERATGVGPQTDLYVISKDKVVHLTDSDLAALDHIISKKLEYERSGLAEIKPLIDKLVIPGIASLS